MSQDGASWSGRSLVVMLDWENFPGIRPSSVPLPLEPILSFLEEHFDVRARLAYAHRSTLSAAWEEVLTGHGFEMRLLDNLIDPNDKKNSLDLCLAMEAVRLSYTAAPDTYALLVAGDKDFAVVSAFIKRRLGRKIVAFGSHYCPNPALAETVDRYFLLEQHALWSEQLDTGTGPLPPRKPSAAKLRKAEQVRHLVAAAIAELGPTTPLPLGLLTPAIRRHDPGFQTHGRIKLSAIIELLGCELSEDRQAIERWDPELVEEARRLAGWPDGIAWDGRHITDWDAFQQLAECVRDGLISLAATLRFPLPLSVLQTAIQRARPDFRGILGKRARLWHILEDLGFRLSDDHKAVISAQHGARSLLDAIAEAADVEIDTTNLDIDGPTSLLPLGDAGPTDAVDDSLRGPIVGHQLALFEPPNKPYSVLFEERRAERVLALKEQAQGIERAEEALHRRIRAEQDALPPGPLFARLSGKPRQKALPFKDLFGGGLGG